VLPGPARPKCILRLQNNRYRTGKSVIILVPEIALTSQLISEFSNHFDNLLVTHSQMTESQRHKVWSDALSSQTPRIVIGPKIGIVPSAKKLV
jgi:primosomal protein N' (replication factor Y)